MAIDWTAAPEGTTHGMVVGRGEVRWYRVGEYVECWSVTIGWTQSFFLTKEEFKDAGLYLYEHGEQSELVMLRDKVAKLEGLLRTVVAEIPHRPTAMRKGNAPGHGHSVPGIWDSDNGELAGKECAWCKVWAAAIAFAEGAK